MASFSGEWSGSGKILESISPINGEMDSTSSNRDARRIRADHSARAGSFPKMANCARARNAAKWFGNSAMRCVKPRADLGWLVSVEAGK